MPEYLKNKEIGKITVMPLLPLRDVVVFPHMIVPLFVGREKSIAALESAMKYEKSIFMVAQKSAQKDEPTESDIYTVGTIGIIIQLLRLRHQYLEDRPGVQGDNLIDPNDLNELDRQVLKESFRQARKLQNRLKLDYQVH
mgnify:CR=1 FL=1